MSTSNLTINTNVINNNNITYITINDTNNINIDDRSPLQSPRAKSPTNNVPNKCPNAPKKIVIPVPRTPRVYNENVSKQLFN